jgi:hypothetical protein
MKIPKIVYVFFIFLSSCRINDPSETSITVDKTFFPFSLEKALDDATGGNYQTVPLSEIGGDISYIPLELNANSAFRYIESILMNDSAIFISDMYRMLEFTQNGKFVRQIGRQGKGPGEYKYAFDLIPTDSVLYLRVNDSRCHVFSQEGNFIRSNKLDSTLSANFQMLRMDDAHVAFRMMNSPQYISPNPYSVCVTDRDFRVVKTFRNHFKRMNRRGPILGFLPMYSFQGNVRFKEWGCDTLYTITPKTLIPYASFDLGDLELPYDVASEDQAQYPGKWAIISILEDPQYFYVDIVNYAKNIGRRAICSKQTGECRILDNSDRFQNDLDGGLPFSPKYVYQDSLLVSWVDAYDLREKVLNADTAEMHRLYGQKFDDLLKLAKSLNDESGTVLVMVKP